VSPLHSALADYADENHRTDPFLDVDAIVEVIADGDDWYDEDRTAPYAMPEHELEELRRQATRSFDPCHNVVRRRTTTQGDK
jgi:hypothetical protein